MSIEQAMVALNVFTRTPTVGSGTPDANCPSTVIAIEDKKVVFITVQPNSQRCPSCKIQCSLSVANDPPPQ